MKVMSIILFKRALIVSPIQTVYVCIPLYLSTTKLIVGVLI